MKISELTIRSQLVVYYVIIAFVAISGIGIYAFHSAQNAIINRSFEQLTSVREIKKARLLQFFEDRVKDAELLSQTTDIRNSINAEKTNSIIDFRIQKFIANGSYYNGFFIYNTTSKRISSFYPTSVDSIKSVISDKIESIYATIEKTKQTKVFDYITIKNTYSLVIGTPIFDNNTIAGILILTIPNSAINNIMLETDEFGGLGTSGETYVVGKDYLMRSTSRFHSESIFKTKVKTTAVKNGFSDKIGTDIISDYRNIKVLSSYARLKFTNINWVIIAEINHTEIMTPIFNIRNDIILMSIVIIILFTCFAFLIALKITTPINKLKEAAMAIGQGEYGITIPKDDNNELGELTDTFNQMSEKILAKSQEVEERERKLQHERNKRLTSFIDGQDDERKRLSRELHDGIGQSLIGIKMRLDLLKLQNDEKNTETLETVKGFVNNTIQDVRRISNNLMPGVLRDIGLQLAIQKLCNETEANSGIVFTFDSETVTKPIDERESACLYRICQEAIHNAVKHSKATEINIMLIQESEKIRLIIEDNGIGFDENALETRGKGLYTMQERVVILQGNFSIESSPGNGVYIDVRIPISKTT